MTSIYVHIPFCKSRCRYCDFYSTTLLSRREEYIAVLQQELRMRLAPQTSISTVYFGGGTPSLLEPEQIRQVLDEIDRLSGLKGSKSIEITMEANPGDLNQTKLKALREAGVNRLSIGIQTFSTPLLQRIGRRHTSEQAIQAVIMAQQAGFDNISVDLMYGLPGQTLEDWSKDLDQLARLHVQHVSAYCLTYEEGTPLYRDLEQGLIEEADDELANAMQEMAISKLAEMGIMRYEVSNYAIPGYESRHNSHYWTHEAYLGIGAGAHSFDGCHTHSFNGDDLEAYLHVCNTSAQSLQEWRQKEELTPDDLYNEMIMLGLRTVKGVDIKRIKNEYLKHFYAQSEPYLVSGMLKRKDDYICANADGWHLLNRIIEDLMI